MYIKLLNIRIDFDTVKKMLVYLNIIVNINYLHFCVLITQPIIQKKLMFPKFYNDKIYIKASDTTRTRFKPMTPQDSII